MIQREGVKPVVRKTVFMLRKFTIRDLIDLTKENPESIRTEIQRMKKNALVVSETRIKTGERGGSPIRYRLTEKGRSALSQEKFAKQRQYLVELLKEKIDAFVRGIPEWFINFSKASELIEADADAEKQKLFFLGLIGEAVDQMKGGE